MKVKDLKYLAQEICDTYDNDMRLVFDNAFGDLCDDVNVEVKKVGDEEVICITPTLRLDFI